ncbi:hypothetical protein [Dysgonomonas sp. 216]|uniref:hypothetical protein n=1 Tax=Dysgonomonas sp. 216 TaxID=2302934 RepID=UPI0013D6A885|nr:hypothetical protein [Dysgonomonas sp. 216]
MIYLVLFFVLIAFYELQRRFMTDSDIDIFASIVLLFYIVKVFLGSKSLTRQLLFVCSVPIILLTFKLSYAEFFLSSLYFFFYCFRRKQNKQLFFIFICSCAIVVFWCIRNIIITGYLVYPFPAIDLFDFDWKMPISTVIIQKTYIYEWAKHLFFNINPIFDLLAFKNPSEFRNSVFCYMLILSLLSVLLISYHIVKKKINKHVCAVYFALYIGLIVALILAPDIRFLKGYIFCGLFIVCIYSLPAYMDKIRLPVKRIIVFLALILCLINEVNNLNVLKTTNPFLSCNERILNILAHPMKPIYPVEYDDYNLNGTIVYITRDEENRTFDKFPSVYDKGLPFESFRNNKIQDIRTIELRGATFQDGFRTKPEYIEILDNNVEKTVLDLTSRYK